MVRYINFRNNINNNNNNNNCCRALTFASAGQRCGQRL